MFNFEKDEPSLRDYFANSVRTEDLPAFTEKEAMINFSKEAGISLPPENPTEKEQIEWGMRVLAYLRYQYADAMLTQRKVQ